MASDDNFDFLSDVIGDDIVVGGVVYSSWEWTRDGEEGVRRLTTEEIEDREAADTKHTRQALSLIINGTVVPTDVDLFRPCQSQAAAFALIAERHFRRR